MSTSAVSIRELRNHGGEVGRPAPKAEVLLDRWRRLLVRRLPGRTDAA